MQAEDGIRYLVRSRGLGDVYKRQALGLGIDLPDGSSNKEIQELIDQKLEQMAATVMSLSLIHI